MNLEHAMTSPSTPLTHRLRRHQFVRVAAGQPVRLCSQAGTLWVTIDGEPADIEVDAGECRRFDRHATMLVGALGSDALVTVTPLAGATWGQRLAAAFGRPAIALEAV